MRNCCSQVAASTVANQNHAFDVNTVVCASIENSYRDIVTVIELRWVNVIMSLPVTKRVGILLVREMQQGTHQDFIICSVTLYCIEFMSWVDSFLC